MSSPRRLTVVYLETNFSLVSPDRGQWEKASEIGIKTYWSGARAPVGRHLRARLLWSQTALYVRFEANQNEPLVVNENPDRTKKTIGLWDRDVCEVFIASDKAKPKKYFEFEIAPTGEWIDLAIEFTSQGRTTDPDYLSGMTSTARIEKDKVVMAIKIPWEAFGERPRAGDVWLGNIFRCVGKDPDRGYLAWRPTMTKEPSFHEPEKFGEFRFTK